MIPGGSADPYGHRDTAGRAVDDHPVGRWHVVGVEREVEALGEAAEHEDELVLREREADAVCGG